MDSRTNAMQMVDTYSSGGKTDSVADTNKQREWKSLLKRMGNGRGYLIREITEINLAVKRKG